MSDPWNSTIVPFLSPHQRVVRPAKHLLIGSIPVRGWLRATVPYALVKGLKALALELSQGAGHIATMLKQCLQRPLLRPKA